MFYSGCPHIDQDNWLQTILAKKPIHLLKNWRGLPLESLSLEGGIIPSALTNHLDRLLLKALISLAHGIGLKVNASDIDA